MNDTDENRKTFVERLAEENKQFYGTPDGRGSLRAFELTFEHRWLYVFELVQNALDAEACSIAIRLTEDGDALIFQHDGDHPLDEKAIRALSKVFQSTKGASSVGFMGIGFKSVFGRFRETRISGWGWKFRYEITDITGATYGDVQPDLLGAVVPIWDESITAPDPGFTTRFEMRRRANIGADLQADMAHLLSDDDHTLLAILAESGLKRFELGGRIWDLDVKEASDGTLEAGAISENGNRQWRLFSVKFKPSKEAIACFLEHRRIRPPAEDRDRVHAEVARPRRVLGLLPLDDDGRPSPPVKGRVYATLPTEVTLPFGFHINADWLLNISRSGLREIEDNPWQRVIVERIADVLASFLEWIAQTFSEPASAQAAFAALALPSPEAGGLEALFAKDHWLSRLRSRIEHAAVLPVWYNETDSLAFATPSDAILPPRPLAKVFKEQPALRPAVLLNGPVVMDKVLGSGARVLLKQADLLAEMSPQDLGRAWPDGLARWWKAHTDDQEVRRALLFRIWAAVAELTEDPQWDVALPCIRSAAGRWLTVNKVVFFDEQLPSKREPGGVLARQLIRPLIPDKNRLPDGWIRALRRGHRDEAWRPGPLSRALGWLENHARRISLQEVAKDAMNALASSQTPDWSVLVPFGHWAKHRNRSDLLIQVLVESDSGPMGVPVEEALLADPYVEDRQGRRLLFPTKSAISAAYLEQDPKGAGAYEWRVFFEQCRVIGKLEVRPIKYTALRYDRARVANFLGLDVHKISESNDRGYELRDFDIVPDLPGPDAPQNLLMALSAWILDGCKALEGTGRRNTRYFFHSQHNRTGHTPSTWVAKLTDLAWVPCDDGVLRRPEDVLPRPDPGRDDAPVAKLSSEQLRVLEKEGVKFGARLPEATALRRLLSAGSALDAETLARLLRECREEIKTDEDQCFFENILEKLTVPTGDSQWVQLDQIVLRAGRGRQHRGTLGGWIVPLNRIDEALRAELEHENFPREFPNTTTAEQALAYIQNVWMRARASSQRLADEVRDVLPVAYAYCLEDLSNDDSFAQQWQKAMPDAVVFAEREWIVLAGSNDIYFDDVDDRRFLPRNTQVRTVTSGHLGHSPNEQLETAKALGLRLLSSSRKFTWHKGDTLPVGDWVARFNLICQLLWLVRKGDQAESDAAWSEAGMKLQLILVNGLVLEVSDGKASPERVPVNALLNSNCLIVSGRPVQFGADAAKELLRHFSFDQRGRLAADLTGMLIAINDQRDFLLAADKFRRSFTPDLELPTMFQYDHVREEKAGSGDRSAGTADPLSVKDKTARGGERNASKPNTSTRDNSASTTGSYTKDRSLAQQDALVEKLKKALIGELVPDDEISNPSKTTDGIPDAVLGDEEYREAVMRYERRAGRDPKLGDPHQIGWDIRSLDPKTGDVVRLIEVKGKGCPWIGDEIVELSRAQVSRAFKVSGGTEGDWYLYVVEKTEDSYRVLPIANPAHAAKWILCGRSWRKVAEDEIRRDSKRLDRNP